jgi:hypothetical protein
LNIKSSLLLTFTESIICKNLHGIFAGNMITFEALDEKRNISSVFEEEKTPGKSRAMLY